MKIAGELARRELREDDPVIDEWLSVVIGRNPFAKLTEKELRARLKDGEAAVAAAAAEARKLDAPVETMAAWSREVRQLEALRQGVAEFDLQIAETRQIGARETIIDLEGKVAQQHGIASTERMRRRQASWTIEKYKLERRKDVRWARIEKGAEGLRAWLGDPCAVVRGCDAERLFSLFQDGFERTLESGVTLVSVLLRPVVATVFWRPSDGAVLDLVIHELVSGEGDEAATVGEVPLSTFDPARHAGLLQNSKIVWNKGEGR